jgi:hypothetical protein
MEEGLAGWIPLGGGEARVSTRNGTERARVTARKEVERQELPRGERWSRHVLLKERGGEGKSYRKGRMRRWSELPWRKDWLDGSHWEDPVSHWEDPIVTLVSGHGGTGWHNGKPEGH